MLGATPTLFAGSGASVTIESVEMPIPLMYIISRNGVIESGGAIKSSSTFVVDFACALSGAGVGTPEAWFVWRDPDGVEITRTALTVTAGTSFPSPPDRTTVTPPSGFDDRYGWPQWKPTFRFKWTGNAPSGGSVSLHAPILSIISGPGSEASPTWTPVWV
jgi:hypothetical protein